jgi:hypothetical protein
MTDAISFMYTLSAHIYSDIPEIVKGIPVQDMNCYCLYGIIYVGGNFIFMLPANKCFIHLLEIRYTIELSNYCGTIVGDQCSWISLFILTHWFTSSRICCYFIFNLHKHCPECIIHQLPTKLRPHEEVKLWLPTNIDPHKLKWFHSAM